MEPMWASSEPTEGEATVKHDTTIVTIADYITFSHGMAHTKTEASLSKPEPKPGLRLTWVL